jgi:hypothetical protein
MKTFSRRGIFGAMGCLCGAHLGLTATPVQAQGGWSPPASAQRCPSRWGPDDRRGSMNLMTPDRAKRAASLIRTGEIVELGHVLAQDMPFFGTRRFDVHQKVMFMNPQDNRRGSNEEVVITEIGQVGTQLDMFPHQTIGDETYNCVKIPEISPIPSFFLVGIGAESADFVEVSAQSGLEHRGGQGG